MREIFLEEMGRYGTPAPEGLDDEPAHLAAAARTHLRNKFMRAKVSTSGANFLVAETGSLVVVESGGQRPDVPDPAADPDLGGGH